MPPNQSWTQYRTVVLDSRAQDFIDRDEQRSPRSDDQWRGIDGFLHESLSPAYRVYRLIQPDT